MKRHWMVVALLAGGLVWPAAAGAQAPVNPLQAAAEWLRAQQQADGGFSNGFAPGSDPATTADAVLAIVAAGEDPSDWSAGGASAMAFLEGAVGTDPAQGPGVAAKLALAAIAAGENPRDFGGADLIGEILAGFSRDAGSFGGGPYDSALCIQALAAAGEPLPEGALAGLLATRLDDGAFSFNGDQTPGAGDSNTTAMAVIAMTAAGRSDAVAPSLAYFRAAQNDDGGWTYQKPSAFGEDTDANSTALVLQALIAAGEDLAGWNDALGALLELQLPGGAFIFNAASPSENLLATVQAMPALAAESSAGGASGRPLWIAAGLGGAAAVLALGIWMAVRRRRARAGSGSRV